MVSLEKLEEIKDLRQVWPHEAADFTRWLAESQNLVILGDTIGVDLDEAEVESAVGDSWRLKRTQTGKAPPPHRTSQAWLCD